MKEAEAKVFLLARTQILSGHISDYLAGIGAGDWAQKHDVQSWESGGAETLVEFAGRLCYRSWKPGLNPNVKKVREDSTEYLANLLSTKHGSVLEHANFTFLLANVSRIHTHELVRHRAGCAYSQESLRYVRLTEIPFWMPPDLPSRWAEIIRSSVESTERDIQNMVEDVDGVPFDDLPFQEKKRLTSILRRIAPLGLLTNILMMANVRALRFIIAQRTAMGAEIEIRRVFGMVARVLQQEAPDLFQDMREEEPDDLGPSVFTFESEKV